MEDRTVKAYGRIFAVCKTAIERNKSGRVTGMEAENCSRFPAKGITMLILKANKLHCLTNADDALIAAYMDEIDPDNVEWDKCLSYGQQGVFLLAQHDAHDSTVDDAMRELGVTKQRVGALIKNGQLDAVKVMGRWRITGKSISQRKNELAR